MKFWSTAMILTVVVGAIGCMSPYKSPKQGADVHIDTIYVTYNGLSNCPPLVAVGQGQATHIETGVRAQGLENLDLEGVLKR